MSDIQFITLLTHNDRSENMPDPRADRTIAYYEILTSYATTQNQRNVVASYLKELRKEFGHNDSLIERALLGAIFEGVHYGNWIWIIKGAQ